MGTPGRCQLIASPEQAHAVAGVAWWLLCAVAAAPQAGASLLPGFGTGWGCAVGFGAGASPGKGPVVTGYAAGGHLLTSAGPCCQVLPGYRCL